jgi:putative PEP-CTERM system TPR-repeat lipoprotein
MNLAVAAIAGALVAAMPIPSTAQKSSRAAGFYDDALARYERKDTAGAIVQLKNALREEPGNLPALMLMGKAQLEMGQSAAAEEALSRALQLGIDRSEVALPMGQALLDQAKYAAVLDRFPAETVPGSRRAELLVLRGHAHKGLRDMKSAAAAFEAARAADPRSVAAILAYADVLARQGRWPEADKLVDEGLAGAPEDPRLLTLRGALAIGRGEVDKALAAFGKALEANPRHLNARMARASLLVDLGRLDAAAPEIAQLAKDVNDPRVTHLRAVIAIRTGDERTARDALHETTSLIDAAPRATLKQRAPELLLVAGMAYAELQERQKARSYLEDYVLVEPKHPGARKLLGSVLLAQGETLAALSALEEAERLQPGDPEVLALIAAAYTARRQYQTATSFLDQAVKRSGGAPSMHAAMGVGLLRQGRMDLGIEHLERAIAKDRGNSQAAVALTVVYLKRGQTKQALGIAEQLVKQDAKNPVAQNLLGMVRGATGDLKGARAAYERALELEKGLVAASLNLAQLDAAEGQHDAARRRLAGVLKERPRDTQAMTEFASVEESAGRLDEAIRWLERVRAIQPRNDTAIARLVDLHLRTRNPDKAIAVAKEAEALMPENPIALGALGRASLALGDQSGARVVLTRMSRLSSADPAALVEVGWLQLAADDARGAAYTAEKALASRPDSLPAQVLLVELELRGGELPKAEQRAKGIVAKHPGSPLGYRLLADVAMARKTYPQAIEGYRTALGKDPSTDSALRLYRAYIQSGATAKGVEFMQTWVKERPNDVVALRALAEGQMATGNLAAARAGYEKVLKLRGEDPILLNNLANVLARHGDRGALEYAERAYRLTPTDPSIQDTLGWILVEQGRVQEGLQHLREARLRNPNDPEIRYHLAAALAKVGRRDDARLELEPVLRPGSGATVTAEARRLWQELEAPR